MKIGNGYVEKRKTSYNMNMKSLTQNYYVIKLISNKI